MLKWRMVDWKLKHKVIFHIVLIGAISGCLLLMVFLSSMRKMEKDFNSRKLALVGTIIRENIEYALSTGIPPAMGPSLTEIAATKTVNRVRILDMEGRILHSSSGEKVGTFVPGDDRLRLSEYLARLGQEDPPAGKMAAIDQSYLPIENGPNCRRCHQTEGRFLGILDIKFDMSEEAIILRSAQRLALGVALLTLIVIIFVTYRLYSRIIEKPLTRLMKSMRRVEGGDLSSRLNVTKKDEFGILAQSFNAMASRLEEAGREAARHHDRQMEKAGHLASLGELAAGLAHEIRNPIAGIRGAAEIFIRQTSPDDPSKEVFEEIRHQADQIHVIIQNLLHFARPREVTLRRENPNVCARAALRMAQHQTEGKDIRFRFVPLEEGVTAELDCAKLQEVILNLLLNAVAAIDNEGEISMTITRTEEEMKIQVEDTGKGIVPEHLPLIFNPFFTTRKKGTGLGLSVCRQIVQALGGTITAESEPGRTIFTVLLPADWKAENS
jgi:signal transduction histidine kinase